MRDHVHREVVTAFHLLAVDRRNHIARLQAGFLARSTGSYRSDDGALSIFHAERLRCISGQILERYPHIAASYFAALHQLVSNLLSQVRRHGETDSDIAALT